VKAAYLDITGEPDVFMYGDLPDLTPGAGEILVRLIATNVNHVDTVWRSGVRPYFKISPPHVLGLELTGAVAALGSGVSGFAIGERVVASPKSGSYAELAICDASRTYRIPDAISNETAACLTSTGATAYRLAVHRAQLRAGQTVVITAGASGTGSTLVQIARAIGCRVIATAGGAKKREILEGIGADATIDHYEEDVEKRISELTDGLGVDAAIDPVSSQPLFEALTNGLKPGGRLVIYGNIVSSEVQLNIRTLFSKGIEVIGGQGGDQRVLSLDRQIDMPRLIELARLGAVKTLVDRTLPLRDMAMAHRLVEDHALVGKVIITPE